MEEAYVVSDLHLGAGDADPGLEDFDQDAVFVKWIETISRHGVTLFLNGDFVDFAQIPPFDVPDSRLLLWTEESSLQKIQTAAQAHPECFGTLRRFVERGGKLQIIIGNHDLDFAWPAVQDYVRSTLLANPPNDALGFTLTAERYHGVLIEHGHAFTPENAPRDPSDFIHEWPTPGGHITGSTKRYLERVWGTDFLLSFYNAFERTHRYADKVKPTLSVLYHGIKNRWIGGNELVHLIVFLKFLKRGGVP